jgi:hypothetical protein
MSSVDVEEVVDAAEDHRQILLAVLFPMALVFMFVSQSGLPIIPITATLFLFAVIVVFYGTLFIDKIEI